MDMDITNLVQQQYQVVSYLQSVAEVLETDLHNSLGSMMKQEILTEKVKPLSEFNICPEITDGNDSTTEHSEIDAATSKL